MAIIEMNLTLAHTLDSPNMRTVFKGDNGGIGFSVVQILVSRFIDSFGFSTKLSEAQLEVLAVDTIDNFAYESLDDIILFFKMARSGKFGTTNRGVDSNLIFGTWFPMYLEKKADLRENNYKSEKSKKSNAPVSMEDVKKSYSKIEKRNYHKKVQAHVDHIVETMDRQMLEDTIVDWDKDPEKKPFINLLKLKRKIIKK